MIKRIVLENNEGSVVRVFDCLGEGAYLIFQKDKKRITLTSNLSDLKEKNIPFNQLAKVNYEELKKKALSISGFGQLRAIETAGRTILDYKRTFVKPANYLPSLSLIVLIIFSVVGYVVDVDDSEKEMKKANKKILKQHIVKIVKKSHPKVVKRSRPKPNKAEIKKKPEKKVVRKKVVKRLGALAVLGASNKKSKSSGGVDLGALKTSLGPGLGGGTQGSGGAQTTLYGKGLMGKPVGTGSNIKGGGGYGTKGKGGGKAGYGQTSLIGSAGTATIPIGEESIVQGGLDPDAIARVIQKNMGQIRFCYEEGLQIDPKISGRVAVNFTIGGNGNVKYISLKSSTLRSQVVEECILSRLKMWKFPIPDGGVDVKVAYPFLLRRMGNG